MDLTVVALVVMGLIVAVVLMSMLVSGFQKCPPNTALIVYGAGGKDPRVIKGGGTYVLPLIQAALPLSLEIMSSDLKTTNPMPMRNGDLVTVSAVAQFRIEGSDEAIMAAAEQLSSKSKQEIANIVREIFLGQLRTCLADFNENERLDSLGRKVEEGCAPTLRKLGMSIVSFTISDFSPQRHLT